MTQHPRVRSSIYCGCGLGVDHAGTCLPDFIRKPGPWNPPAQDGSWAPFTRDAEAEAQPGEHP